MTKKNLLPWRQIHVYPKRYQTPTWPDSFTFQKTVMFLVLRLLNVVLFKCTDYLASNVSKVCERRAVKEVARSANTYFKALFKYLPGGVGKTYKKSVSLIFWQVMVPDYPSVSFKTVSIFNRLMKMTWQFCCLHVYVYVYHSQFKNKKKTTCLFM